MSAQEEPRALWEDRKGYTVALALLLTLYFSSYTFLSWQGRYEPSGVITHGGYSGWYYWWAPRGYPGKTNPDGKWLFRLYLPLWLLDKRFWHTHHRADSEEYPITQEVARDGGLRWETVQP